MDALTAFLDQYGYPLFAAVGFAEYAGVPIASVPVLVTAGAVAAQGGLHPGLAVLATAGGGLLADTLWFLVSRWQGERMVGTACGLTSNPRACVHTVRNRVEKLGARYVLSAKFVPGAANLIAAGAGLSDMRAPRFLSLDAIALLLWAGLYLTIGRLFDTQVEAAVVVAVRYGRLTAGAILVLLLLGAAWRILRSRRHAARHGAAPRVRTERRATSRRRPA
ncbi:MAG: DedA family protein [Gemmatimonadota bacterium]